MPARTVRAVIAGLISLTVVLSGLLTAAPANAADSADSGGSSALVARYYAAQPATTKAQINAIRADLPATWTQRLATLRADRHVGPSPADLAVRARLEKVAGTSAARGPDDYACSKTRLFGYLDDLTAAIDERTFSQLYFLSAFDLPTIDALLNGAQGDPRFAITARYRSKVVGTFTKEQTFWPTSLTGVQLAGMDGGLLTDQDRLTALYVQLDAPPKKAAKLAAKVVALVSSSAVPQGSANPLFSANAFAVPAEDGPGGRATVVMGTGILDAMSTIGLGKAAPQFITSHEMGHQLQFASGIFDDRPTFANIRRIELEADGFAGYFSAHPKGLRLSPPLLAQGASAAYQVGDCYYGLPGSHGTPNQRRAATDWGVAEVVYADDPSAVATAEFLDKEFTKALRVILLPDADPTPADFRALVAA